MKPITNLIRKLIVSLILFQFVLFASGQQKWTLEECIQYAQEQNISIKRNDLQADGYENSLKTAKAARLPALSGWATHNLSSGKTVNFEDYTYINTEYQDGNVGIRGDLSLFTGLEVSNRVKQQKMAFQAAIKESERLRNSIAIQVSSAFLQVIFAEEIVEVAKQQHLISLEQVENTKLFVEEGTMAKSNLLEMKAQAARDEYALIQSQNQVKNAKLDLSQLMNLPAQPEIDVQHPSLESIKPVLLPLPDDVFMTAITIQPQIKSAEYLVKASKFGLASARGANIPSLGLDGIFYSRYSELGVDPLNPTGDYSYGAQLADNSYGRVSLNLSIPIYNRRQNLQRINAAKIQSIDAKYALDEAKIMLRQEIVRAYTDANNALGKYQSATNALASISEAHAYIKAKYESGLATSLDFNISKGQLVRTQSDQLQAKYEYLLRSKILDFYRGLPIII